MSFFLRALFRWRSGPAVTESGQVLVLFGGGLVAFMGLVSLATDVGSIVYTRTKLQSGADAAVLAGIQELNCNGFSAARVAEAETAAATYANENVDNITSLEIEATSTSVTAIVEKQISAIFGKVVGLSSYDVSARARADAWCNGGGFGIIALNLTACNALDLNGDFDVDVTHGDVIVNSSCKPNAIDVEGSTGSLIADGIYTPGYTRDPGSTISPPPKYLPPVPDPYANIDTPDVDPSPVYTDCSWGTGGSPGPDVPPGTYNCPAGFTIGGNQPVTFAGGEYAFIGGMIIQGNGQLVTFGEGTYVFRTDSGDGLSYTGGRDIDASAGVLFYNTCGDGSCGTYSYSPATGTASCSTTEESGRFLLAGNGSIDISPYSGLAGDFSNVVFFQDRCSTTEMEFTGTSTQLSVTPTGGIYGKSAHLDYAGTASGSLQIVSDTIEIRGTVDMAVDVENGETVQILVGWALTE